MTLITIPGYRVTQQLYCGSRTQVYRGVCETDQKPVALKLLKSEYPTFNELLQFRNQYAIAKNLDLPGIVKHLSLENYRNGFVLVMEDFGGIALSDYISAANQGLSGRFTDSLEEFFRIAIQITETLEKLYHNRVIHKDIKPQNILINPQTQQVKLIDFSISSLLPKENQEITNPNILEGTLTYISPEQTGRMNRGIDYRTDYYSLGVTFYELLTGQLPFPSTDPMELVHCHIARMPTPLIAVNPAVPPLLNDIVMKLMAKTAEDRYQTAFGLRHDLERCLDQYTTKGSITAFELGTRDICDRFVIPEKLYGRETEVASLLAAFDRIAGRGGEIGGQGGLVLDQPKIDGLGRTRGRGDGETRRIFTRQSDCGGLLGGQGGQERVSSAPLSSPSTIENPKSKTELMLVSGFSGIGKTVVVNEVHKPIARQRGYFIKGKFDQFKRDIPFSAFVQAFQNLMRQLLVESAAAVQQWQVKILEAVGQQGKVITDVIPELEKIIGKQPAVPELAPSAAQNRFNLLFQKFIRVFATCEHPLVIFLDDLQWVDSASLKLMQLLMSDRDTHSLLLIGAYRDNEVSSTHPLMLTLEEIRQTDATINQITLAPLDKPSLNHLIADTLSCPAPLALPLTELVLTKTKGNPFFTNQFLKSLHEEGLISFDIARGYWQCDITQIRTLALTDDVVEFMALQLQKLPEQTQAVLKLAACIGNQFDLVTLAIVYEKSTSETAADLWRALQEGLILPNSEVYKFFHEQEGLESEPHLQSAVTYRFLHDRVQQAAYLLIPEDQKQATHLRIGQLLLSKGGYGGTALTVQERDEKIFDIVNQLNIGVELITQQLERDELAQLNLMAGHKAKASTAYAAAAEYLRLARELLAADSWINLYDLTLNLYVEAVEAEYLNTNFERSQQLVEVVLAHAKTLLDKVKVYEAQIQSYISQNQMKAAVDTGLQVLDMLGISLVRELPTQVAVAELAHLPEINDPNKIAALRILCTIASAAYLASPELYPMVVFSMAEICSQSGNSAPASYAYACCSLICEVTGEIELGYQFGQLSLQILEKFHAREFHAKVVMVYNACVRHWKEHSRATLDPLLEAVKSGMETGDIEYACYAAMYLCIYSFFTGEDLKFVDKKYEQYIELMINLKQEYQIYYTKIWRQLTLNLQGLAQDKCRLIGEQFNEDELLPILLAANNVSSLFGVYFGKLVLNYLLGNDVQAVENAQLAEQYAAGVGSLMMIPQHNFYYSLALLAQYPHAQPSEQADYLRQVESNQEKMKTWACHAPSNFQHKYDLVAAEKERVLGHRPEAMDLYDQAIAGAKANEYIQEEALANELTAKFYLGLGKEKVAQVYLTDAYLAYARWGAKAKVEDLEQRYPQYLAPILLQATTPKLGETIVQTIAASLTSSSTGNASEFLDFATVIKASQALSREVQLDKLLSSLMQVAIENAGASKGTLILSKAGKLVIEATGSSGTKEAIVLQSIRVEQSQEIPIHLINYVYRTCETLVLDNASASDTFSADPYILEYQPKSVLCTPIIYQGQFIGILYLENNLTTKAFTPDRLEVLNILSAQAAISITNAQLYAEIKESQSQLTQFLNAMPVGVSVHKPNGQLYYANPAAQELMGISAFPQAETEQLPQAYHVYRAGTQQLYPTDQLPIVRSLNGERVNADDLELHQPDKIIPIEISTTPIFDETGKIVYAIAAFQDITSRKQAEKLIAEYNHTLEEQVKERTAQLALANQEIMALNERLKAENLRMSAELEVTKQLQQMILPKQEELESIEGLDIAGYMEPADEVGGDYYDVLQQNGRAKISIGDVTGHGLESGVVMLMAQTAVRTLQESQLTDPVQFLDTLNRTIYRNVQRINPYKNLTLSVLDYTDGYLSVSGQHEEIIVVRASGQVERIDTRNLGFPLGLDEEIADFIASQQVQLNSGDVVVLYTDGITEAFDINQEQYGVARLCDVVARNCDRTASEIRQVVIEDLRRHIGEQKVFDDITLLVLKQK